MPNYTTSDIRNIALLGPGAAGKTSLAEALLLKAGAIHHLGAVERGSTVSDCTDEEKHHRHSIFSSLMHMDHQGRHINLIDTPGYADFAGQAISVLPAVETAAIVIDAAAGLDPVSRRMMERATERGLCRMVIINKIDHDNINLPQLLADIQQAFGKVCLPVNLPAKNGTAVVDCFFNPSGESDLGSVADAHKAIVEQVVEVDEDLMAVYLEQGDVKPEQLHAPFEKALREGHLIPLCFTSARRHDKPEVSVGIAELLDVLLKLAPSPLEGNPAPFLKRDGSGKANVEIHPEPDASKHALAEVFQVTIDPFVGKLCAFRVHQGTIRPTSMLFVGDPKHGEGKKPFKVGHLFKYQGKEHVEIEAAIPGDIAAVAKIEEIHRDAVLHDHHDEDRIHLLPLVYPEPMSGLAITPKRRGEEQKIADALAKVAEEDPTFHVSRDSTTHETVIRGLGELHLRMILERLKNRFHVEVDTKQPKIGYRETITVAAEGHHRHKKQTGGAGQFGEVYLRVQPGPRGSGFEFIDDTFGGSIPRQFIPAIEKGIRTVLETGAIAGYPLQDLKVSVYDGKYHDVDSKEIAFSTAGRKAFIDAVVKAKPVLLEPCVKIAVTVPNHYMGDITGDLSGKRGRIQGADMLGSDTSVVQAIVPLSEVTNYQSQLKSVTGGQGSFTMEFSHFDPVPPHMQQQIVAQWKPRAEED
ncbi:MAG: elongation factor G [Planctomycetota bacterium]|nr:elongation factor G [Planctomycetota bacterium]